MYVQHKEQFWNIFQRACSYDVRLGVDPIEVEAVQGVQDPLVVVPLASEVALEDLKDNYDVLNKMNSGNDLAPHVDTIPLVKLL